MPTQKIINSPEEFKQILSEVSPKLLQVFNDTVDAIVRNDKYPNKKRTKHEAEVIVTVEMFTQIKKLLGVN